MFLACWQWGRRARRRDEGIKGQSRAMNKIRTSVYAQELISQESNQAQQSNLSLREERVDSYKIVTWMQ